jgi:hypothetical protein
MGAGGRFLADILMSRLSPLAIAIAAIYLSFQGRKEKKDDQPSSLPPIQHDATQTASPHIEQKVIIARDLLNKSKEIPPKPETPKSTPNIIFMGARLVRIRAGIGGSTFWESESDTDPYAAIACFRNEPSMNKKVAPAFDVKGAIIYRDAEGREIGTGISEAFWVGEPISINFTVQTTRCVILAILTTDRVIANFYRRETHSHWGTGLVTESLVISEDVKTIELRLLQGNELLIRPLVFDFAVTDERPEVKLRRESLP